MPALAAAQAPPLGHEGRWLTDRGGRVLMVHGLDIAAKRPPYRVSAMGFGEDDARWIAEQGFSVVRLGFIPAAVMPAARGAFDDAYLDDLAATVRMLDAAGLLVVLDAHQDYWTESTGGEGFPGWMTTRRPLLPVGRADAPAFDGFWANERGIQDAFAEMWAHVAARMRDVPGILAYDLFNEPFPGAREQECASLSGCPSFDRDVLNPFYRRVIAAIRAVDATRLVMYEPQVIANQGAATAIGDLGDGRAVFAPHLYCSDRPQLPACESRRPRAFDNAERQARAGGDALFLGEFGATDDMASIARDVDLADARMVPWSEWAYFNEDPCCARPHEGLVRSLAQPPAGENVKQDKLAVLARPYPRLTAGTPTGWSWDAQARLFRVSWTTEKVGGGRFGTHGVSELVLPPAAFPGRFRVTLNGARIRGSKTVRRLRVVAKRGARTVSVAVRALP
jgi:endoglycosylceramidase